KPVKKLLLEKALPFYKRFRALRSDDPESQVALWDQLSRVGYITHEIGRHDEARKAYEQARDISTRLLKDHPTVARYRNDLPRTQNNLGVLLGAEGKGTEDRAADRQRSAIRARMETA